MLALVRQVVGVLFALMSNHGRAAVEALVTVLARVQLYAMVTVSNVVSQLHALKELGATLIALVPESQNICFNKMLMLTGVQSGFSFFIAVIPR